MSTSYHWRHSLIAIWFVISKLFRLTLTVMAWPQLTSFDLNFVKDQIVLSGDSAGGQLTIAIGLYLKQEGLSVKGLVPLYPMTQILSIHLKSMQTGILRPHAGWVISEQRMIFESRNEIYDTLRGGRLVCIKLSYNGHKFNSSCQVWRSLPGIDFDIL